MAQPRDFIAQTRWLPLLVVALIIAAVVLAIVTSDAVLPIVLALAAVAFGQLVGKE